MHIWLAASVPSTYSGGVNRNKLGFAAGLEERGHTVTAVFNDSSGLAGHAFVFPVRLCARLLLARHKPDWIMARSFDGVFCALACRFLGLRTKTILHNHGWEEYVFEVERRVPTGLGIVPRTTWKAKFVRFPLIRLMLKECTLCVSGTIGETRLIKARYPGSAGKLRYVPNGVTTREYAFWDRTGDRPLKFLCIGWFSWKKNVEHTLDIFSIVHRRFPEAMLYLVGTGIHGVPRQVEQRKMQDCVFNMGDEKFEAMETWYTQCPFLISSSRYEGGHSLAILEAMSYGMVVFASGIPSTVEFVRDGHNGVLLDGCDTAADAEKMAPFITDADGCRDLRRHAFETALRNRWARQQNRLARVLEQKP